MDFIKAILLAIVEGVTEFLPISSTGHLILVEDFLRLGDPEFADAFMVIIQFPAILSVLLYFWKELWPFQRGRDWREPMRLWLKTAVAFLPAMVLGVLYTLYDVEEKLFNPVVVACALIVGGVVLIAIERRPHSNRFPTVHALTFNSAFLIGVFQCLAMIPGTSRSAATIMGALLLGASRAAAAEFSFFLAIPTMAGATVLTLAKSDFNYTVHQWALLAVGCVGSFLVAYGVIAFLMRFIRRHSFIPFGIYRIALGALVLALLWS